MTKVNEENAIRNTQYAQRFIELALEYAAEKVPYRHRGISRRGCDCTGLIIAIAREMGFLADFKLRQYRPDWNLHAGAGNQVIEELEKFCERVPNRQAGPADIAVMRFGRCPAHCGIIVNKALVFVHSLKTNLVCKKSLLKNSMWAGRWIFTYRICWNQ